MWRRLSKFLFGSQPDVKSEFQVFADDIAASGLIGPHVLHEHVERIRHHGQETDRINALSDALVACGYINEWHAEHLRKGRYKGYFLSDYKLTGHLGIGDTETFYSAVNTHTNERVEIAVTAKKFAPGKDRVFREVGPLDD